jgi:hypothetical protein
MLHCGSLMRIIIAHHYRQERIVSRRQSFLWPALLVHVRMSQ